MAEIRFEEVSKRIGNITVIAGLTLTIADGEFFTFVGPSGCGKTTILNMIAGLDDVTQGRILFDGVSVQGVSPKDRDVAMVFQSYALYPHMNVYANIAFPLHMRRMSERTVNDEVRRVVDLLGLGGLLGRMPRELSGGQRQRVALGRAIVRRPKVFLMDEPLSNLDARLRVEMRAELKRLHQDLGTTVVYVTHDQAEAMGLSGRMAVLEKGTVRQVDVPRDIYRRPVDLFVAGFIGSPPMNLIPCTSAGTEPFMIECLGSRMTVADSVAACRSVIAGIRPEHLQVTAHGSAGDAGAAVLVAEQAGSDQWVEVRWGDLKVRGRARPEEVFGPGDRVILCFDEKDVVFFDGGTGMLCPA